jgi:hypothetical protein
MPAATGSTSCTARMRTCRRRSSATRRCRRFAPRSKRAPSRRSVRARTPRIRDAELRPDLCRARAISWSTSKAAWRAVLCISRPQILVRPCRTTWTPAAPRSRFRRQGLSRNRRHTVSTGLWALRRDSWTRSLCHCDEATTHAHALDAHLADAGMRGNLSYFMCVFRHRIA